MKRFLLLKFRLLVTVLVAGLLVLTTPGMTLPASASIDYGTSYEIKSLYEPNTYLDSPDVPATSTYPTCDGYNASAAAQPDPDESTTWKVVSASGKAGAVQCNDLVHLVNQKNSTYLDVCFYCSEVYCVSTSSYPRRDGNSGTWKVLCQDTQSVSVNQPIFLQNQYRGGPFLDVNGAGCDGNVFCVTTALTATRDGNSGTWVFAIPGASEPIAVDIDSVKNVSNSDEFDVFKPFEGSTPVTVTLQPGTYTIKVISKSEGGKYDAWNRNIKVEGCNQDGDKCAKGWEHIFFYEVGSEIKRVKGTGRHETVGRALFSRPQDRTLTLEETTDVDFYVSDQGNPSNNQGGVSLQITP